MKLDLNQGKVKVLKSLMVPMGLLQTLVVPDHSYNKSWINVVFWSMTVRGPINSVCLMDAFLYPSFPPPPMMLF